MSTMSNASQDVMRELKIDVDTKSNPKDPSSMLELPLLPKTPEPVKPVPSRALTMAEHHSRQDHGDDHLMFHEGQPYQFKTTL